MDSRTPRPEHPRPQLMREHWLSLNGVWSFEFARTPHRYGTAVEEFVAPDRGALEQEILVPFAPESPLSGIGDTEFHERVLYHRSVAVPAAWKDQRILLHFGAVDFHTDVYVNGSYAGSHTGGSAPFTLDITAWAQPGETVEVLVAVQDYIHLSNQASGKQSKRGKSYGCLYTRTTGIWQTVWLEAVSPGGIEDLVILTDPDQGSVTVIPSYVAGAAEAELTVTVFERVEETGEGEPLTSTRAICRNGVPVTLTIANARLWWPGDPWLYGLELSVTENGREIDRVQSYTGIRSVSCRGGALQINGESVYQRLVLDQGFYPDGIWTAPDDQSLRRDIEISMAAGFNGARLHQKVFERRFYYWADRLGYLTWAEWPSWGLDYNNHEATRAFVTELAETVSALRNHPSIVAWTPYNETWDVENRRAHRINHTEAYEMCRRLDPTRPVNSSSGGVHWKTDLYTVHDYSSDGASLTSRLGASDDPFRPVKRHAPRYEGQPYIVDEFGGVRWGSGGWGYGDGPATEEEFFERIADLMNALHDHPLVAGWCYTQLTDVEQEQNGVYTYSREKKFATERWAELFSRVPPGFDR